MGKGGKYTEKYIVPFPISISRGLPRIIPINLRREIEEGNRIVFKVVFTILSIYRILSCDPILKLNTITDPFKGICSSLNIMDIKAVRELLVGSSPLWDIRVNKVLNITTAGPNYKVS